jgi:hypothetical protein
MHEWLDAGGSSDWRSLESQLAAELEEVLAEPMVHARMNFLGDVMLQSHRVLFWPPQTA